MIIDLKNILEIALFQIAGAKITILTLFSALFIIIGTLVVNYFAGKAFELARVEAGVVRGRAIYVVGRVVRYSIFTIGFIAALSSLGLNLTSLSLFAGALGVGVGLGLQDVVKNFVAGIILLFDKSIAVGDYIELEDKTVGAVTAIGLRATTVTTNDNIDVLVPNVNLVNGKLTNWTRNHATRRVRIPFIVAYGTDKELVKKAGLEAAKNVSFTMKDTSSRQTMVWLVGFGDNGMHFELVIWPTLEAVKTPGRMNAAYNWALHDALIENGIEIPFPQRDIRIRNQLPTLDKAQIKELATNPPE